MPNELEPTAAALVARAKAHQDELDRDTRFLDVQMLAARWGVSPSTVRAVPSTLLPYVNVGTGLQRERRRYHPEAVAAYEASSRPDRKAG
jgi:hypothetical protein